MCILYANPYNIDANGFYFESAEEFETKAAGWKDSFNNEVEEFSIEHIEGDDGALFRACGVNQCNLSKWFDDVEDLDDEKKAALYYLTDCIGYRLSDALEKYDDVSMYEGRLIDAATEWFDERYLSDVPEAVRYYIDYDSFADDLRRGGDMAEFQLDGTTWTVTNAAEF